MALLYTETRTPLRQEKFQSAFSKLRTTAYHDTTHPRARRPASLLDLLPPLLPGSAGLPPLDRLLLPLAPAPPPARRASLLLRPVGDLGPHALFLVPAGQRRRHGQRRPAPARLEPGARAGAPLDRAARPPGRRRRARHRRHPARRPSSRRARPTGACACGTCAARATSAR